MHFYECFVQSIVFDFCIVSLYIEKMILPTVRQLTFLVALSDYGSFIAAANAVAVTQPSLTAGIKELEAILGVQLVERGRKGCSFTQAGKVALARARIIIANMIELSQQAAAASEPLTGSFRMGIIPTIAPFLSPKAVPQAKRAYPKLKLYLREEQTARLIDSLMSNELDAAIIALPYEAKGIETAVLFDDEFLFVAPKSHKFAKQKSVKIDEIDLADLLLLEDGHCLKDHTINVCGGMGLGAQEVRATSLFTLVQMVAGGMGTSLIPKMAIDAGLPLNGLVVKGFSPPIVGRQIGLAWRKGSSRAKEAEILGRLLCQVQG